MTHGVPTQERRSERDPVIDMMRGFAICLMIATHVSPMSRVAGILHLPFPVGSAADWFVMLSGIALAMRERRMREGGRAGGDAALWRRAGLIYAIHCTLTYAVLVVHQLTGALIAPDIDALGHVLRTAWLIGTLQVQPASFMNILPMYVVLLPLAPLLLRVMQRGGTAIVVGGSAMLWLAAQRWPSLVPLPDPATGPIQFSLAAWQFAFVVGLWLGHRWHAVGALLGRRPVWALITVTTIALFIAAALQRSTHTPPLTSAEVWVLWFGKPTWAPGAALYAVLLFCGVYVLLFRYHDRRLAGVRRGTDQVLWAMQMMGRKSLLCFVMHIPFALATSVFDPSSSLVAREASAVGALAICCLGAQLTIRARHTSRLVPARRGLLDRRPSVVGAQNG